MHASLLRARRFGPLFATQFLGAFNDNLFKNAIVILISFRSITVGGIPPEQMVALTGAVFIAPYFLFSALAGQISDKLDKGLLIRATKVMEIVVMGVGAIAFWRGDMALLLLTLFLMGAQSTLFGPCKYSILPQHLQPEELVAGNALIELGTYLAILLGTMAGGLLIPLDGGERVVAVAIVLTALLGWLASQPIPPAPSPHPDLRISWHPIRPTAELWRLAKKVPSVYRSILGISWFWLYGSAFLSLFPTYTKDVIGGTEAVATLFLALFSVGIGLGSMLCERFSRERLELGLVPIGALGLTVFTLDLAWIGQPWPTGEHAIGVLDLLSRGTGLRIAADLILLAMSGGFMIVPMYTLVQWRTDPAETSRVIAANNIINAVFMVAGAVALAGLFALGLGPISIFVVLALVNAAVAIHIYTVVPEFLLRFVVWSLSHLVYRLSVRGGANVPVDGPVLLIANHVSFIDWFVISAAIKRPARFVMHHSYYKMPVVKFLFRQARVIPIGSAKEDPARLTAAMAAIDQELADDQVVCVFPEGALTPDGQLQSFRPGIERILADRPVPVVPVALRGLWGSFFSRQDGSALRRPFRRIWSRIEVVVGPPLRPEGLTAADAQAAVAALLQDGPTA